jgi:hypothetical protein
VFFLEGEWELGDLGSESLRGVMDTLASCGVVDDLVCRDVSTVAEFEKLVRRWAFELPDYFELAYFASHGSSGRVWLDQEESVSLSRLGELLEGACEGRVIHLGGCSTLKTHESSIVELVDTTRARAVMGYTETVDMVEAAAFEMLLIYTLSCYDHTGHALNAFEKHPAFHALGDRLGFEMWEPRGTRQ